MQKKHKEWHSQWLMLKDDELFLFKDWIYPNVLEDFKDKEVLECGCGGGAAYIFYSPIRKKHHSS